MHLQRLYYVASVPTHLFFIFIYLPSTSTNRLVYHALFSTSTCLFFAPVYACLRACSSTCSTFSAHSSSINFWMSSANAARHLRAQRAAGQSLMVNTIDPAPEIRQVPANTCSTSSTHYPRPLHHFLHRDGGGSISSASLSLTFQSIFCLSIPMIKAHSCGTPISTGKADMHFKSRFPVVTVLPILPVILYFPICPLL